MFVGGAPSSGPKQSGEKRAVSEASDGLLVDATNAIKTLMKPCARKGRRLCGPECAVHQQSSVLDKEEMLGYLMGDLFGLPLIPQPSARSVGEAARLRASKAGPMIEAVEKRLGKSSGEGAAAVAAELATLRGRVVVELPLPSRRACAEASGGADVPGEAQMPVCTPSTPLTLLAEKVVAQEKAKQAMHALAAAVDASLEAHQHQHLRVKRARAVCERTADDEPSFKANRTRFVAEVDLLEPIAEQRHMLATQWQEACCEYERACDEVAAAQERADQFEQEQRCIALACSVTAPVA